MLYGEREYLPSSVERTVRAHAARNEGEDHRSDQNAQQHNPGDVASLGLLQICYLIFLHNKPRSNIRYADCLSFYECRLNRLVMITQRYIHLKILTKAYTCHT